MANVAVAIYRLRPIQLKDPHATSYTRQYPLRQTEAEEAERQIQQLLKEGLIAENDNCLFNSPIFVIRKKDSSFRFIQDLRKVNSLLKPLLVALPRIDDLLQDMVKVKPNYITITYLYKGYWNIRITENSSHITGFTPLYSALRRNADEFDHAHYYVIS